MIFMQIVVLCLKLSCLGVQIIYKDFPKVIIVSSDVSVLLQGIKIFKSPWSTTQDRIMSVHWWNVSNQIHRTISKWPCWFCSFSRDVCWFCWGSVNFKLLAGATSLYVVLYKCSKSWPPIVLLYCIVHQNFAWVSCCFMIMKALHYFSS